MARSQWLSTEDAARELGFAHARWVRRQIDAGRLRATVVTAGQRPTYHIARRDFETFCKEHLRDSWDAEQLDGE